MLIRPETTKDYDRIYALIAEAFATAEHADGNESELVVALRNSPAYVPELALVAETAEGELVGYILFTVARIGRQEVLVLAPLAVRPAWQKQGIGAALIRDGHRKAAALGYGYSLVLGSDSYYPRFGYKPAEQFGITVPDGIPSMNFMAIELLETAEPVRGTVVYPKAFGL